MPYPDVFSYIKNLRKHAVVSKSYEILISLKGVEATKLSNLEKYNS